MRERVFLAVALTVAIASASFSSSGAGAQEAAMWTPGSIEPGCLPLTSWSTAVGEALPPECRVVSESIAQGSAAGVPTTAVSGTVTEEGSDQPLQDVCVLATDGVGGYTGVTTTDQQGHYTLTGVWTGAIKMWFGDCGGAGYHRSEWLDNADSYDDGLSLYISVGGWVANADLAPYEEGGAISGTVTSAEDSGPVAGTCVSLFGERGYQEAIAITDDDGVYSAEGLDPGTYNLRFSPCEATSDYAYSWYPNATEIGSAAWVSVSSGEATDGTDAVLIVGGGISGTIASVSNPMLLSGVCVSAYDGDGTLHGVAISDRSGEYTVRGLRSGSYLLHYEDCQRPKSYRSEWYADQETFQAARPVSVGAPRSTLLLPEVSLAQALSISGYATASRDGVGLASMCVDVRDVFGVLESTGITGALGYYEVGNLRSSSQYVVLFRDCRREAKYTWSSLTTFSGALLANAELDEGGLINGNITGGRSSLWNACIYAVGAAAELLGIRSSDRLGDYGMALEPGQYYLLFADCSGDDLYHPEWYNDEPYFELADAVSAGGPGSKRSNINADLGFLILGDASCNGQISSIDATLVLQAVAALFLIECPINADPNEDVRIDAIDATLILQFVAGLIDEL